MRRYTRADIVGNWYGISDYISVIHSAAENGRIQFNERISTSADRLDTLAGEFYGDGKLWWIIAAASGIGWSPQVPAGTLLRIPTDINSINTLIG